MIYDILFLMVSNIQVLTIYSSSPTNISMVNSSPARSGDLLHSGKSHPPPKNELRLTVCKEEFIIHK